MESRPWYKRWFVPEKNVQAQKPNEPSVREYPVPPPTDQPLSGHRASGGATKGAFGNHKRRIPKPHPVNDPAFNHALRRINKRT